MPIILSRSGALRALIVGGRSVPRVASHSVLLTRGYVCLALRAGEEAGTDCGLLALRVRCISQKYARQHLEETHPKRKSANAISQRLSSLNILIPTIDSDNFWELYPVFQKSFSHISDKTKESEIDRKLSAKNKRQSCTSYYLKHAIYTDIKTVKPRAIQSK